jgi:hypothetical protein
MKFSIQVSFILSLTTATTIFAFSPAIQSRGVDTVRSIHSCSLTNNSEKRQRKFARRRRRHRVLFIVRRIELPTREYFLNSLAQKRYTRNLFFFLVSPEN